MKKAILLVLLAVLSFTKTSIGQVTIPTYAMFEIRYEYHPFMCSMDHGNIDLDFTNNHVGKFFIGGPVFFMGNNYCLEVKTLGYVFSTSKVSKKGGLSVLYLTFRKDLGRFNPIFNIEPFEVFSDYDDWELGLGRGYRSGISGGFDFYITNTSMLTLNIGLSYQYTDKVLSPFVTIGYKIDKKLNDL